MNVSNTSKTFAPSRRQLLAGGAGLTIALRNRGQLRRPLAWSRGDAVLVGWQPDDGRVLEREA
jgi:hypothetical protein